MKGHEYVKELVRNHIVATMPGRLTVLRNGQQTPFPRDPQNVMIADQWPTLDSSFFPAILVRSTSMAPFRKDGAGLDAVYTNDYTVEIGVAVEYPDAAKPSMAAVGRDRLLLALRETLYWRRQLAPDAETILDRISEQTGIPQATLAGNPLSTGMVKFIVRVEEHLSDPATGPAVVDLTFTTLPLE